MPSIPGFTWCRHGVSIAGMDHVRLTLRIPEELHNWLNAQARYDRRSLNSQIVHLLEATRRTPAVNADSPGGKSAIPAPLREKPDSSPA